MTVDAHIDTLLGVGMQTALIFSLKRRTAQVGEPDGRFVDADGCDAVANWLA
jgi:hypothetical protein